MTLVALDVPISLAALLIVRSSNLLLSDMFWRVKIQTLTRDLAPKVRFM